MWTKIKRILIAIGAAIVAGLFALLGIEKRKRVKAETARKEAEKQIYVEQKKAEIATVAKTEEKKTEVKIIEAKEKETEEILKVATAPDQAQKYNDLIQAFNNKGGEK